MSPTNNPPSGPSPDRMSFCQPCGDSPVAEESAAINNNNIGTDTDTGVGSSQMKEEQQFVLNDANYVQESKQAGDEEKDNNPNPMQFPICQPIISGGSISSSQSEQQSKVKGSTPLWLPLKTEDQNQSEETHAQGGNDMNKPGVGVAPSSSAGQAVNNNEVDEDVTLQTLLNLKHAFDDESSPHQGTTTTGSKYPSKALDEPESSTGIISGPSATLPGGEEALLSTQTKEEPYDHINANVNGAPIGAVKDEIDGPKTNGASHSQSNKEADLVADSKEKTDEPVIGGKPSALTPRGKNISVSQSSNKESGVTTEIKSEDERDISAGTSGVLPRGKVLSSENGAPQSPSNREADLVVADSKEKTDDPVVLEKPSALTPRGKNSSVSQSKNKESGVTTEIKAEDEQGISEGTSGVLPRGEVLSSENSTQSDIEVSIAMKDATQAKDEPGTTESPTTTSLRVKVLPSPRKTNELETAPAAKKEEVVVETSTAEVPDPIPSVHLVDASGNPTTFEKNDVLLSALIPSYKAVMYAEFRKLGPSRTEEDKNAANEVFQKFNAGGGRFFKFEKNTAQYYSEVDGREALKIINRHFHRRIDNPQKWLEVLGCPPAQLFDAKTNKLENVPAKESEEVIVEIPTAEIPDRTPSFQLFDVLGEPTTQQQNDVLLSFLIPSYKAAMYAVFRQLGPSTTEEDENAVNEVFQKFKNRGGRFFKRKKKDKYTYIYTLANEEEAYKTIKKDINRRMTSSQQWLGSGDPTYQHQNDILLCPQNPSYRDVMYELFPKLGLSTRDDKNAVNEVFQKLKAGGGRFFKRGHRKAEYLLLNEEEAFEEIKTHTSRRKEYFKQWSENAIRKKRKSKELACLKIDGHFQGQNPAKKSPNPETQSIGRSRRKRSKPQVFMDSQGQDLIVQELLREQSAVAKKRKKDNSSDGEIPFSVNENRQFEQGCCVNGWGNWEAVQQSVTSRTIEECSKHAAMIEELHPEIKERLIEEFKSLWVYSDVREASILTKPTKPPLLSKGDEKPMNKSKSGLLKEFTHKTNTALSITANSHSTSSAMMSMKEDIRAATNGERNEEVGDKIALNSTEGAHLGCKLSQKEVDTGKTVNNEHDDCYPRRKHLGPAKKSAGKRTIEEENQSRRSQKEGKAPPTSGPSVKEGMSKKEDAACNSSTPIVQNATKGMTESKRSRNKRNRDLTKMDLAQQLETGRCVVVGQTKAKRNRSKREQDETERNSAQPVNDANSRRPKRQSALNARKMLKSSLTTVDEGDDSTVNTQTATSSATISTTNKLLHELLSGLSDAPPNDGRFYEEESAWRFHNPAFPDRSLEQLTALRGGDIIPQMSVPISPTRLQPLPPAPPLPDPPTTKYCNWSFDEDTRVLLANFRESSFATENGKIEVAPEDEEFLLIMMERDDITVISEGLADALSPTLWTREYIEGCIGTDFHHKFRGFETTLCNDGPSDKLIEKTREKKGWYSMKVADYFQYLEQRRSVKSKKSDSTNNNGGSTLNESFEFTDSNGEKKSVNVNKEALYMIDVDMVKLLPQASEDFQHNFKLPGILPGGSHCMMNAVNASGRPFMGPNLYITPPSSFTSFHQDGHGTVDSGHLCLSGYNEVVMLRRLTERHKCHAMHLLTGTSDSYSTLYGLPHQDDVETRLGWPSKKAIDRCQKMHYYPSVFTLKPGQVVHINKGRLHAFRKLSPSALHKTDCHFDLRQEILRGKDQSTEDVCFSVAWDWMFKGVTSEGINREISGILECARLNREHDLPSLAIPETSLLFLARENVAKFELERKINKTNSLFQTDIPPPQNSMLSSAPNAKTVLRGILPSLQFVVNRHSSASKFSETWEEKTKNVTKSWRVSIESKPNAQEDPSAFALDPYGAGDFFCKFCSEELSNVYMHCDGCEKLLDKDFNICSICHMNGKYKVFHQMHPFNEKKHSILNHTGNKTLLRQARCPCKNGKPCGYCTWCTGCSCRCHQRFTLHYRFMGLNDELQILGQAESIVGCDATSQTALETKARLFSLISDELPEPQEEMPRDIEVDKPTSRNQPQVTGKASVSEQIRKRLRTRNDEQIEDNQVKPTTKNELNIREEQAHHQASVRAQERKLQKAVNEGLTEDQEASVPEQTRRRLRTRNDGQIEDKQAKPTTNNRLNIREERAHRQASVQAQGRKLQKAVNEGLAEDQEKTTSSDRDVEGQVRQHVAAEASALNQKRKRSKSLNRGQTGDQKKPVMRNDNLEGRFHHEVAAEASAPKQNINGPKKEDKAEHCQSSEKINEIEPEIHNEQDGRIALRPEKEHESVQDLEPIAAYKPAVTFHCDKCDSTFNFTSASNASASFANHVKWCGTKSDRQDRRRRSASRKSDSSAEKEDDDTEASVDESLSEATPFDPDELKAGSRVMVLCKQGKAWQATVKKRHEKNHEQGFNIHYDGKKKGRHDWVPVDRVVGFIQDDSAN